MTTAPESAEAHSEYARVGLDELDTCYEVLRLADPATTAALARSIERHGIIHPLTVNQVGDAVLVLLDGFKRLSVARDIGLERVPVRVLKLAEAEAKVAMITFNRPHRGLTELEEAWVVRSLVREHGKQQQEVAVLLGRHKSWVCRRLLLAERVESSVVDDIRMGLVAPTVARELVRLPRGNHVEVAEAVQAHGLTTRQTHELVERLVDAEDEQGKRELLATPLHFLTSPPAPKPDRLNASLSRAGNRLRASLSALKHQARQTSRTLIERDNEAVLSDVEVLSDEMDSTLAALGGVSRLLEALRAGELDDET